MNARLYLAILICIFIVSGCRQRVYELDLTPEDERMHRKLVCYRVKSDSESRVEFPAKELARIAAVYPGGSTTPEKNKHAFEGLFTRNTPEDIGGAGYYLKFDSPLGALFCYGERFRGTDDMAGVVQDGLAGSDWLVDRFVEWLEGEFDEEPWWLPMRAFIHDELRREVKNLLLFLWMQTWSNASLNAQDGGRKKGKEVVARIVLYLAEREYFQLEELPWMVRVISAGMPAQDSGEPPRPWKDEDGFRFFLNQLLSRKLELGEPAAAVDALMRFFSREDIEKSWEESVKSSMEWKERVERWEMEKLDDPKIPEPRLETLVEEHLGGVREMVLQFFATNGSLMDDESARIRIHLAGAGIPDATNGIWNEEEKRVEWSGLFYSQQAPPAFAYALWVQPDEAFQEAHFGRTLLQGMDLAKYVTWYAALGEGEARQWDQFLSSVNPEDDLLEKIKTENPLSNSPAMTSVSKQIFQEVLKSD